MPGPVFQGRCVLEIEVPTKTVIQHECERCRRTWYADTEKPKTRLLIDMQLSNGEKLRGDFGMLCDSCERTAANGVKNLLRTMKKNSPDRRPQEFLDLLAKKEGNDALPKPTPGSTDPDASPVRTSKAVVSPPSPSAPSKRS